MMAVRGTALESRLGLGFEVDERGVTRLTRRSAGGLCHVGKPYWNGEVLLTQLINPTAGLFSGDRIEAEVELGPGASVLLSNPSATRLHTMPEGATTMDQVFRLGAGSFLEVQPDLLIPQRRSAGRLRTRVEADADAAFFFLDLLAPGRTAHGESLAWRDVTLGFEVAIDGRPVVREWARLGPSGQRWRLTTPGGKTGYLANAWLRLPQLDDLADHLAAVEHQLHGDGVCCGASLLEPGLGVVRILSDSSVRLRDACRDLRSHFAGVVPALKARSGKL